MPNKRSNDIVNKRKGKLDYDKYCKKILSNKRVIARILKSLVLEFKDIPIDIIIDKCLKSDLNDSTKVLMSERKLGNITCDLLFNVYTLDEKEICFIINVESQSYKTNYPLINRCEYYTSRLLSNQRNKNNDYKHFNKVFSIWINADSSFDSKSGIYFYTMKQTSSTCSSIFTNNHLLNFVVVNIGDDYLNQEDELISYLSALLLIDEDLTYDKRKDILKDDIIFYAKDEKEFTNMGNMSQYYIDKGEQRGEVRGAITNSVKNICSLMSSLNISFERALDILKIDESIKDEVIKVYKKTYC